MSASSTTAIPGAASSMGNGEGHGNGAGASSSSNTSAASGPPYLCPTCKTSYSRLEYLRRHERRHADIRPFVCDCGKGFSRSDVLSRHKRQCNVVLNGGDAADTSVASSKSAGGSAANGSGVRKASAQGGRSASSSTRKAGNAARNSTSSRKSGGSNAASTHPSDPRRRTSPDDDDDEDDSGGGGGGMSHAHLHSHVHSHPHHPHALQPPPPPPPSTVGNSFPFPQQPGVSAAPSAPSSLLPPAPYGSEGGGGMGSSGAAAVAAAAAVASNNLPFGGMLPHHMSSFNNLVNQQHNYPSSPESNGTLSQHGSPRFAARDMARHGSNGSRFSLRKGGSFDHIGPRSTAPSGFTPNQFAPEFWDALDPAAKNASGMAGMDYVSSGGSSAQPSFNMVDSSSGAGGIQGSMSGSAGGGGMSGSVNGVTTPRGEPQRFAVSTGPLSPFSSIALSSTMSPYLSAFSNARDTPFVASPSRGIIPGTPGSSLNVFDWTMRPPSKPASSTAMAKRDSLSQTSASGQQMQSGGSSQGGATAASGGASGGAVSSPNVTTSSTPSKRKREDEEGSRKSPRIKEETLDKSEETLDEDHRTAAELLGSLRNAGARVSTSSNTDTAPSSSTSPSTAGVSAPAPADHSHAGAGEDDGDVNAGKGLPVSQPASSSSTESTTTVSQQTVSDAIGASLPVSLAETHDAHASLPSTTTGTTTTAATDSFLEQASVTAGPEAFALRLPTTTSETMNGDVAVSEELPAKNEDDDGSGPGNLTLSQLIGSTMPPASEPATAANIAQSSWEALMNGNGWASITATEGASQQQGGTNNISSGGADAEMKPSVEATTSSSSSFTPTTTAVASTTPSTASFPATTNATSAVQAGSEY